MLRFAPPRKPRRLGFEGVHLGMTGSELTDALGALGYVPTSGWPTPQSFTKNGRQIMVRYTLFGRTETGGSAIPAEQRPAERLQFGIQLAGVLRAEEWQQALEDLSRDVTSHYGEPASPRLALIRKSA